MEVDPVYDFITADGHRFSYPTSSKGTKRVMTQFFLSTMDSNRSRQPSAEWTLPGLKPAPSQSPCWLKQEKRMVADRLEVPVVG